MGRLIPGFDGSDQKEQRDLSSLDARKVLK